MKVLQKLLQKPTGEDSNRAGIIRKMRGEAASSTTYSEMNESSVKLRKMYVDHPNDRLKLTYSIHGPGNHYMNVRSLKIIQIGIITIIASPLENVTNIQEIIIK